MNITTVTYQKCVSYQEPMMEDVFGETQTTIGASASVSDGDTPESVLAALRAWVQAQFPSVTHLRVFSAEQRLARAEKRRQELQDELSRLRGLHQGGTPLRATGQF